MLCDRDVNTRGSDDGAIEFITTMTVSPNYIIIVLISAFFFGCIFCFIALRFIPSVDWQEKTEEKIINFIVRSLFSCTSRLYAFYADDACETTFNGEMLRRAETFNTE